MTDRIIRRSADAMYLRAGAMLVIAGISFSACGTSSNPVPTAPSGSSPAPGAEEVVSLEVSCPPSVWIGERRACLAVARLGSGQAQPSNLEATWSSARPDVIDVDALGTVIGRSAGQTMITASYRGRQGSAPVMVSVEDGLQVGAASEHGDFRAGSTVTMWLVGYYSVASSDSGRLTLRITDQGGTTLALSPARTVGRGGDSFVISSTFVVPQAATQVCRTAILEAGVSVLAEPKNNDSGLWCIAVRQ